MLPYVRLASRKSDKALERMICGVINRQASDLTHDPFANAFNLGTEGGPHQEDLRRPNMTTHVFEGKFEL